VYADCVELLMVLLMTIIVFLFYLSPNNVGVRYIRTVRSYLATMERGMVLKSRYGSNSCG
jgi:hypothetical protein